MKKVGTNSLRGIAGNDFSLLGHISTLEALSNKQGINPLIASIAEKYLIFYQNNFRDESDLLNQSKLLDADIIRLIQYWPKNNHRTELKAKVINAASKLLIEYLSPGSRRIGSTKKYFSESELNFILSMLVNAARIDDPFTQADIDRNIELWLERSMVNKEIVRDRYDFLEQHQSLFEEFFAQGDRYYPLARALMNPMLGNGEYLSIIKDIFSVLNMAPATPISDTSQYEHRQALEQVHTEIRNLQQNN